MYRKEVNERSPMRVFEKSMRGGLGRGNVGVIASTRGMGKTPLLVQIALDNLLRDRRVLHLSHEHAVDHVRTYYSEVFSDISSGSNLENPESVLLDVERNRMIFSLLSDRGEGPQSRRGGRSSITRIHDVVEFARKTAHFNPDVLIVDGFDLVQGSEEGLKAIREMAQELDAEVWLSATTDGLAGSGLPAPLDEVAPLIDVVVYLEHEDSMIRLRLLKDHDNQDLSELNLRLDLPTMQVVREDVPQRTTPRPRDPSKFRLVSGGSRGAEAAFGECAERWGVRELNFSFEGHRYLERQRGVVVLSERELDQGDFSLVYASKRLNRKLTDIPFVRDVLKTIWHQITNARQVFAVGVIQDDGVVKGGTGWGVELARLWKKPLFVFDQERRSWFRWTGRAWEMTPPPAIMSADFAGVGTQQLSDVGRKAIEDLFERSFGSSAS